MTEQGRKCQLSRRLLLVPEAVFDDLKGVDSVESGYMGGKTVNPSYEEVCSGETGHAEVAQLSFDPKQVSFRRS